MVRTHAQYSFAASWQEFTEAIKLACVIAAYPRKKSNFFLGEAAVTQATIKLTVTNGLHPFFFFK